MITYNFGKVNHERRQPQRVTCYWATDPGSGRDGHVAAGLSFGYHKTKYTGVNGISADTSTQKKAVSIVFARSVTKISCPRSCNFEIPKCMGHLASVFPYNVRDESTFHVRSILNLKSLVLINPNTSNKLSELRSFSFILYCERIKKKKWRSKRQRRVIGK